MRGHVCGTLKCDEISTQNVNIDAIIIMWKITLNVNKIVSINVWHIWHLELCFLHITSILTFSVDISSQLSVFSHIEAFSHLRVPQEAMSEQLQFDIILLFVNFSWELGNTTNTIAHTKCNCQTNELLISSDFVIRRCDTDVKMLAEQLAEQLIFILWLETVLSMNIIFYKKHIVEFRWAPEISYKTARTIHNTQQYRSKP